MSRWVCRHPVVRCVHGDEINRRGGARMACVDCGRSVRGPLPVVCTDTGADHASHAR